MKTSQQVEKELEQFIKKFLPEGELSVEAVKKLVYEESGAPLGASHKYHDKFFGYFGKTGTNINEILQIATDAWNYFPHETLGGKSPHQIVKEYQKKSGSK